MDSNKENEDLVLSRLSFMDKSIENVESVSSIQNRVFEELSMMLIKDLDVDSQGNILRTRKNQKSVQKMTKIRRLILTPEYRQQIGKFLGAFDEVKKMSDKQIKGI